jgi:hypothetical protein
MQEKSLSHLIVDEDLPFHALLLQCVHVTVSLIEYPQGTDLKIKLVENLKKLIGSDGTISLIMISIY